MEGVDLMQQLRQQREEKKQAEKAEVLEAAKNGLAIHGEKTKNREGEETLLLRPDLDSRAALYILELAGIEYPQLTFVKKGESVPGGVNIDTGERPDFVIEDDGSVFFDHHGGERADRGASTSAAKIVYEKMVEYGLLKKEKWLDTLVDFVTGIDNADYPLDRNSLMKDWSKSLYGLHKVLPFETIVDLIKDGRDPAYPFSPQEIMFDSGKTASGKVEKLNDLCAKQQKLVEYSTNEITVARKRMEDAGIKNHGTKYLGDVLLNIVKTAVDPDGKKRQKNKIPLGFTATRALGFNSYVLWSDENASFFITSQFHLGKAFDAISKEFPEAKIIRGTMIICAGKQEGEEVPQKEKLLRALEMI